MKCPVGTWQRARRTRLRKGVRGERWILDVIALSISAGGGGGGLAEEGAGEGRPIAERMSGCDAFEFDFVVGFCFFEDGDVESCGPLFPFCPRPFDFPRTARLCWSNSTRLTSPSAIASPSERQPSNCCAVMWLIAGLAMRSVQGLGVVSVVVGEVEFPMTASRITRAKQ